MVGNPIFRFRLIHSVLGTLEISEPDGWKDAKLQLIRDENYHSLVEGFVGGFWFYGDNGHDNGGINFIREVERLYGIDADLTVDIDVSFDSGSTYEDIFTGLYDFTMSEETNKNKVKSAITTSSLWANFMTRIDTPVDIRSEKDLDGGNAEVIDPYSLRLTSQKIQQQSNTFTDVGFVFAKESGSDIGNGEFLQFSFSNKDSLDEIDERYTIPNGYNTDIPANMFTVEYGGDYAFNIRLELSIVWSQGVPFPPFNLFTVQASDFYLYLKVYLKINENDPIELTITDTGGQLSWTFTYTGVITLQAGDEIRLYGSVISNYSDISPDGVGVLLWGRDNSNVDMNDMTLFVVSPDHHDFGTAPSGSTNPSFLNIVAQTIFPESFSDGLLVHDVFSSIVDRISPSSFYSDYLGSDFTRSRQYPSNGCGWKYANMKGLHIRTYSMDEKLFFQSFNQQWAGLNPILNLGACYDTVNGEQVIRIEEKEFFYKNETSVNFDFVYDITRRFDEDWIFNKIECGYNRWESENISGIDDPQTKQVRATRFKKVGRSIQVRSDFIAASLAIESTRRQLVKKTKDYRLDNETFVIAVEEEEASPGRLIPELNENFTSIFNLLNPDTRYNSRITPARNFLRWINVFNGALQKYTDSFYKFVSGEGNYDMSSDLIDTTPDCDEYQTNLSESQDISVTTEYLHLPDLFEITIEMGWDDYVTIRENKDKGIGISQTDSNHTTFFIKDLQYELCNSRAVIQAWPKTPFYITNTDFVAPTLQCASTSPVTIPCDDALLTEILEELITENEDCLIFE